MARKMLRTGLLLLGCLLVFDAATPLWPGAFRFDPTESVEALHAPERPRAHASVARLHVAATSAPAALPARNDCALKRPRDLPRRRDCPRESVGIHARGGSTTTDDD